MYNNLHYFFYTHLVLICILESLIGAGLPLYPKDDQAIGCLPNGLNNQPGCAGEEIGIKADCNCVTVDT